MPPRVLVVDDEQLIRWSLRQRLERQGYEIVEASTAAAARASFLAGVDAVLLDYQLPDCDGLGLLRWMRATEPEVPTIMLTAHSSVENAVLAMREGAFHYASKPFDADQIALTVERALEATRLRREIRALRASQPEPPSLAAILGRAPAMLQVKELTRRVAGSACSTVLITGESGTGKNLIAGAIHAHSDRADHTLMNITCSALPAELLESELFGHERGSFTGAHARKEGLLELADGGTVFLDEIGEMDPALQAKLLRVLEDRMFRRVGGTKDLSTDVRIIAATNADLREAVQQGRFRCDLYYRLAVLTIHLPPLRDREGDVDLIVAHLIDSFSSRFGKRVRHVTPEARELLRRHPWPGNVRELRNAIERAVLLSDSDTLDAADFAFLRDTSIEDAAFRLPAGGIDIRDLERSLVVQALERTGGNQTKAAKLLGMNRDQIRYRIERYGLSKPASPDHC